MTETELIDLFRRALRASLAVPLVAAAAGCSSTAAPGRGDDSGQSTGHTTGADAGHSGGGPVDAGRDAKHASGSGSNMTGTTGASTSDTSKASSTGVSGTATSGAVSSSGTTGGSASTSGASSTTATSSATVSSTTSSSASSSIDCTPVNAGPTQLDFPASCLDGGVPDFMTCPVCPAVGPNGAPVCACAFLPLFDGGAKTFGCTYYCEGRAFAGMERPSGGWEGSPLGGFLAATALLEAASIDAFRILRDELRAHDAPPELAAAAEAAARDEVRHARVTRRLARRHGGQVAKRPRAGAREVRPLAEVAEENAVEGCVRETYAALVAHHRALVAEDPEVREAMAVIAEDETRHAALAWRVAAWAEPRLDAESRRRVRAARADAVRDLREALGAKVPASLTDVAGVPPAESAARMLAVLERELWGAHDA